MANLEREEKVTVNKREVILTCSSMPPSATIQHEACSPYNSPVTSTHNALCRQTFAQLIEIDNSKTCLQREKRPSLTVHTCCILYTTIHHRPQALLLISYLIGMGGARIASGSKTGRHSQQLPLSAASRAQQDGLRHNRRSYGRFTASVFLLPPDKSLHSHAFPQ